MIAASELRIGNWVDIDGINYTVNGQFLSEIEKPNCTYRKSITPIPLSPDILVKCGFEQEIYGVWYTLYLNKLILDIDCENGLFEIDESGKEYPIKYLHQLQNLFFALCGEELNIQL